MGGFLYSLYAQLLVFWLPDGMPDALRAACKLLFPAAALLFAAAVAGIWVMPTKVLMAIVIGWLGAFLAAILCWVVGVRSDGQVRALTRQNADLYRRIPEDRRPPLLRHAR